VADQTKALVKYRRGPAPSAPSFPSASESEGPHKAHAQGTKRRWSSVSGFGGEDEDKENKKVKGM
jgi:hypothetical protein